MSIILEGPPKNPDTMLLKNSFYKKGLFQRDIWNYYINNKDTILKEVGNRNVLLFIYVDMNKFIIRRKNYNNIGFIKLDSENYEKIINGRTVSISVEIGNKPNYGLVDIDVGSSKNKKDLKVSIQKLIGLVSGNNIFSDYKITLSATGYHFYLYLKKSNNINVIRNILLKLLNIEFKDHENIKINAPARGKFINLDLSSMYDGGSHTVTNALSRNGLICLDVTKNWETFDRKDATIGEIK